jgi:hypothetical protein
MQQQKIRPGRVWYIVAGLVHVVFVALLIFFVLGAINNAKDSIITRVTAPGTANIDIDKAGKYAIYIEYNSVLNGKVYHTEDISDMYFMLTNKKTGEQIDLDNSAMNESYSANGRSGERIFDFEINEPGVYVLETEYDSEKGEDAVLAIGHPFVLQLVMQIFLAIGSLFLAIIVPVVIFIITLIKRGKSKKMAALHSES